MSHIYNIIIGFPGWLRGKECTRHGFSPQSVRSSGERYDNPLHYSCLGNPMNRGAWLATVHGVTEELDIA